MKTSSNDLFRLIKTLTGAEKMYFKKVAGTHRSKESNGCLRLFDAIEKQEEYDEKEILKEFKGTALAKFLAQQKQYLFSLVLKTLSQFHSKKSSDALLVELIRNIEILFNKDLLDLCSKKIEIAKGIAKKYEQFGYLLTILEWEEKFFFQKNKQEAHTYLNKTIPAAEKLLVKYQTFFEVRRMLTQLRIAISKSGRAISKKTEKEVRLYLSKTSVTMDSYIAKDNFYQIQILYNKLIKKNYLETKKIAKNRISLAEQFPHMIKEHPSRYAYSLYYLIIDLIHTKQFEEAKVIIDKFRKILSDKNIRLSAGMSAIYLNSELDLFIETGNFYNGTLFIEENISKIDTTIKNLAVSNDHRAVIPFNIAITYFGNKEYRKAIHHLNNLLNDQGEELRRDLRYSSSMLALICYFEEKNYDALEINGNRFIEEMHFFSNKRIVNEEKIIRLLIQLSETKQIEWPLHFSKLKKHINSKSSIYFMPKFPENFDLLYWIQSHIEKKSFAEVFRREKTR